MTLLLVDVRGAHAADIMVSTMATPVMQSHGHTRLTVTLAMVNRWFSMVMVSVSQHGRRHMCMVVIMAAHMVLQHHNSVFFLVFQVEFLVFAVFFRKTAPVLVFHFFKKLYLCALLVHMRTTSAHTLKN